MFVLEMVCLLCLVVVVDFDFVASLAALVVCAWYLGCC